MSGDAWNESALYGRNSWIQTVPPEGLVRGGGTEAHKAHKLDLSGAYIFADVIADCSEHRLGTDILYGAPKPLVLDRGWNTGTLILKCPAS